MRYVTLQLRDGSKPHQPVEIEQVRAFPFCDSRGFQLRTWSSPSSLGRGISKPWLFVRVKMHREISSSPNHCDLLFTLKTLEARYIWIHIAFKRTEKDFLISNNRLSVILHEFLDIFCLSITTRTAPQETTSSPSCALQQKYHNFLAKLALPHRLLSDGCFKNCVDLLTNTNHSDTMLHPLVLSLGRFDHGRLLLPMDLILSSTSSGWLLMSREGELFDLGTCPGRKWLMRTR